MDYARRAGVLADIVREEADYMVVELKDGRRVRWRYARGPIAVIEFGSLNPKARNYQPGGRIIRTVRA